MNDHLFSCLTEVYVWQMMAVVIPFFSIALK